MRQVPMLDLGAQYEYMKGAIDSAIKGCLGHQGWILGPEVKALEDRAAAYLGARNCVGVSSGTEALVLSLRALAIKLNGKEYFDREDEIITTPFTFTATGDAILRAGATPVFVDIDPETYNIDPAAVERYLDSGASRVAGIVPVHLYGQSCDMDRIMDMAKGRGLFVLEDVAQAFGATWKGRKLGSIGNLGAFSFFPSKNLGGFGDGGMVATNDDDLSELVRILAKHGGKDKYNAGHIGYNARLDTLQAAVLLAKLGYIDELNERRMALAAMYDKGLSGLKGLSTPKAPYTESCHVYHQYTIYAAGRDVRDGLQTHLKGKGITSMVYYPVPLHRMGVFGGAMCKTAGSLPVTEKACAGVLSLPVEPLQREETTEYVIASVREYFGHG